MTVASFFMKGQCSLMDQCSVGQTLGVLFSLSVIGVDCCYHAAGKSLLPNVAIWILLKAEGVFMQLPSGFLFSLVFSMICGLWITQNKVLNPPQKPMEALSTFHTNYTHPTPDPKCLFLPICLLFFPHSLTIWKGPDSTGCSGSRVSEVRVRKFC